MKLADQAPVETAPRHCSTSLKQRRREGWLCDLLQDVNKYQRLNGGGAWKQVLTEETLWAMAHYRFESWLLSRTMATGLSWPVKLLLFISSKVVRITTGILLPGSASIGPGLHLPHAGGIVIHGSAVIGCDCCISQGVTIGISGRNQNRGVPHIGNRVYIGANAVVVGRITVGDDAVIGANSLVNRDVPPHCTFLGVPAVKVSNRGSEGYL